MRCRYCAGEEPDEVKEISLRKALKGVRAEFLIYHYPEKFDRAYWPSVAALDPQRALLGEEWAVIDFAAKQCVRYTRIETGHAVEIHPCFEQDMTLFKASGELSATEAFTGFFKRVTRDGETRGRKATLTIEQIIDGLREGDGKVSQEKLAEKLSVSTRAIQQALRDSELTFKECKQLASGQLKKTVTIPVEGSQVRQTGDSKPVWSEVPEGEKAK